MPNYSLVVGSQFKPFTYQELLAPALMQTQAHEQLQDAYADMSNKASIWDNMANAQTDPQAHQIYQQYADDLKNSAATLAQQGLTPESRQNMLD